MKGIRGSVGDHGTTSRYTYGCRCDLCKKARREYQREYYRTHPRPVRTHLSYWSQEEFTRRSEARERTFAAIEAAEPCIRCTLRGSGYPLCTICLAELRGQDVSAGIPNDLYIENCIPLLVEVIKNGYREETYEPKEHRWMMDDVHTEAERFRAAVHADVDCGYLEPWRQAFIRFLGAILEVLPVR